MKRLCLFFSLLIATLTVNAQVYYRCTGDNVNVRKGPGLNYSNVINQGFESRCQLFKNDIVKYAGKIRNGFVYVLFLNCGETGASCYQDHGWVSAKYLKTMTRKCTACNGKGFFNRPCTDTEGPAEDHYGSCPCQGRYCLHDGCHLKQHCKKCNGVGYL